jgi:hypothetical protein
LNQKIRRRCVGLDFSVEPGAMFLHFRVCKLSLEFFTWVFLHSTKVQALEHELAGVKEDRKRLEEGGSHNLTIIDEVRNWGGTEKWVRAVCARALLCATLRGPAGTLRSLQKPVQVCSG